MDNLSPIYRIEFFLDAIVNGSQHDLDPIYRVEFFLAKIAGADVEIQQPLSRMEMFLAQLCGESLTLPTPQSRTEQYLAAICGEDVEIPPFPVYRIEYWLDQWAQGGGGSYITLVGDIVRFMASRSAPFRKFQIVLEPIQAGSGDPSPENIRPISGRTSATVTRTGKNLFRLVEAEAIKSGYDYYIPNPIPKAGSYKLTCQNAFGGSSLLGCAVVFRDSVGGTNIGAYYAGYNFGNTDREGVTTTITAEQANAQYIVFLARSSGLTFSGLSDAEIQIELGSTATSYEPYACNTYTIQLGQTVYGGTLDVLTGTLTVTMAMVDLGTLDWVYSYGRPNAPLVGIKPSANGSSKADLVCTAYKNLTPNEWYAQNTPGIASLLTGYIGNGIIGLCDPNYTDAQALKTALSGVRLVYELATPIEISLTPQTINSLVGENNVWDDGTVTVEVKGEAIT